MYTMIISHIGMRKEDEPAYLVRVVKEVWASGVEMAKVGEMASVGEMAGVGLTAVADVMALVDLTAE